jgi:hypothetical protein
MGIMSHTRCEASRHFRNKKRKCPGNKINELLNVHRVSDVRQIEIHTADPLVPDPIAVEVEIAIANLKKYKSPGSDAILAELVQAGGETL